MWHAQVRNPFNALVAERKRVVACTFTYWDSHITTPSLQVRILAFSVQSRSCDLKLSNAIVIHAPSMDFARVYW